MRALWHIINAYLSNQKINIDVILISLRVSFQIYFIVLIKSFVDAIDFNYQVKMASLSL